MTDTRCKCVRSTKWLPKLWQSHNLREMHFDVQMQHSNIQALRKRQTLLRAMAATTCGHTLLRTAHRNRRLARALCQQATCIAGICGTNRKQLTPRRQQGDVKPSCTTLAFRFKRSSACKNVPHCPSLFVGLSDPFRWCILHFKLPASAPWNVLRDVESLDFRVPVNGYYRRVILIITVVSFYH